MFKYLISILAKNNKASLVLTHEQAIKLELKDYVDALPMEALARKQYFALIESEQRLIIENYNMYKLLQERKDK